MYIGMTVAFQCLFLTIIIYSKVCGGLSISNIMSVPLTLPQAPLIYQTIMAAVSCEENKEQTMHCY